MSDRGGKSTPGNLAGMWTLMRGFRLVFGGAVLGLAIAALARTLTMLLLRYFVDRVLDEGFLLDRLYVLALGFVILALVEGGATFFRGKLAARSAEGIVRRLRNDLYNHIQHLPFNYHDRSSTGDLIERVTSDVDTLRRFFAEQAVEIGRIITLFFFNLGALLILHPRLGGLAVVCVPLVVGLAFWFFKHISEAYQRYQEQEARLSSMLQENISSIRIVRGFARQDHEQQKFERENWEKYQRGKRWVILHSLYWPITDIICTAQLLFVYFLGALMTMRGEISLGTYISMSGMVIWVIWPMRNLGRVVVEASSAMVSFTRVRYILDTPPEQTSTGIASGGRGPELEGQLIFDSVSFGYDTGEPALSEISFACQPGEVIALLGRAGSGKTTLVNLLPRFYDYTSGSLKLDGRELKEYALASLRAQIGIVEQEPFLFSRTITENIRFGAGRPVSGEEIEAAARAAAIHDVILGFPEGYDTRVGERGVTLSGGQKQRIAIARTLLKDPRILILDDATSSVDSETETLIQKALAGLMKGRTSFVIAHRIQTVLKADKILVLDRGRIVQEGTHEQLLRREGFYRQVVSIQTDNGDRGAADG